MKNLTLVLSVLVALLLSGCSYRVADLTLASSKNVDLKNGDFTKGERVVGEDTKPIILFPLGSPSIKEAVDMAIEKNSCAVALTDVSADYEFFSIIFGYIKYEVEGDLVIDRNREGCERSTL